MNRDEFMDFFRDDDKLNSLSTEDRIEVFETILPGDTDISKERLNNLLGEYSVDGIWIFSDDDLKEQADELALEVINTNYHEMNLEYLNSVFLPILKKV